MSNCKTCAHWLPDSGDAWDAKAGKCTLWPEWRATPPQHFCAQFVEAESGGNSAAQVNLTVRGNHNYWKDRGEQQARAIKAEKTLKAVRAQLRELKRGK